MARKKKQTRNPFVIKFIVITLLTGAIGFGVTKGAIYFFRNTKYFRIQSVVIDSALQFIDKRDLQNLIGKNIFEVDLKSVQRRLSYKYPRASDLKVVKRFPSQIAIVAKERFPLLQVQVGARAVVLDEEGIILSVNEKADQKLPVLLGAQTSRQKMTPGLPFDGRDTQIALKITNYFKANTDLSSYSIHFINVENLSKIYVTLSNELQVILDREKIAQRIKVLGVVLSQGNLDMNHVKYVDLRFKEPIIGKK